MAIVNKTTLTAAFEQGDVPQGSDFASLIDSNLNLAEAGTQTVAGSISVVGSISSGGISSSSSLALGVQSLMGVGTVQGTAAVINSALVIGTNDVSNTAFVLPNIVGTLVWFVNTGAQDALVFPPVGAKIDSGSTDASVTVNAGDPGIFICESSVQYRSLQSVIQGAFS